jgi:CheY-like chemotaxis protein
LGLTNLIGQILDLSKIEAGRIELENIEFSLPELLNDAVHALGLSAQEKGVQLRLKIEGTFPYIVSGDPTRIRQIMLNLISNALKFTARGEVEIVANAAKEIVNSEEIKIEISVRDSGIGIPTEKQNRLFEAFMQADSSTTRKFGGSGLGLNLSKNLAQAMGGDLFLLSSQVDIGSTFCVNLKVCAVAKTEFKNNHEKILRPQDSMTSPNYENELYGMIILLVEDSEDNQFIFGRYLKKAGAKVEFASDGLEGVEKAQQNKYHAILMDVQMPKLDGYGATKKIRQDGIKTPIIALTAHAMKEERENALRSGFDGYLIKPLNPLLLIETLRDYRVN